MNQELPDTQTGFRKGKGTKYLIANIRWIIEKERELQKSIYFCFFDFVWITAYWKILKEMGKQTTLPVSWEICMKVKKQQLELDMEQQMGSKSGKEYMKAVYCHPAYLTYMQNT